MMQPADHREGDDVPPIIGLALTRFGGILIKPEVGPEPMIVLEVLAQDALQVPITRSQHGFCHGDPGAVSTSSIPIARTRRTKFVP
jgi:hypothetical protein